MWCLVHCWVLLLSFLVVFFQSRFVNFAILVFMMGETQRMIMTKEEVIKAEVTVCE